MTEGRRHATWGGRFSESPAQLMVRIGESVSFDKALARFDLEGSRAHAAMLARVGLIGGDEAEAIREGLDALEREIEAGEFAWDPALEDVHMNIEQALTRRVPAAAKLHTARSRNDQIATDMRLWFKDAADDARRRLSAAMASLVGLAERCQDVMIPGYTHLQRAQPVSMAHHLLAYVEMFDRDRGRLDDLADRANVCPLGSGAIAGSTLPIDRAFVARELGFVDGEGRPRLTQNGMDAVSDRDLFVEYASACALIGTHLSRLAEDFILWNSAEFDFVRLPDAFATGSSLMPHKKNPDAFELIRGKAGRLAGHVPALLTLLKGLPLTYNRDLQEDKPPVFEARSEVALMLDTLAACVPEASPNRGRCAESVADPALLATDVVDYLVRRDVPFREAHHVVGALVAEAERQGVALNRLDAETARSVHPALGDDWTEVFDLRRAMEARENVGMPGPGEVAGRIRHWKNELGVSE